MLPVDEPQPFVAVDREHEGGRFREPLALLHHVDQVGNVLQVKRPLILIRNVAIEQARYVFTIQGLRDPAVLALFEPFK